MEFTIDIGWRVFVLCFLLITAWVIILGEGARIAMEKLRKKGEDGPRTDR